MVKSIGSEPPSAYSTEHSTTPLLLPIEHTRYWALDSEFTDAVLWRHDLAPPSDHCLQQVQDWCTLARAVRVWVWVCLWWRGCFGGSESDPYIHTQHTYIQIHEDDEEEQQAAAMMAE